MLVTLWKSNARKPFISRHQERGSVIVDTKCELSKSVWDGFKCIKFDLESDMSPFTSAFLDNPSLFDPRTSAGMISHKNHS
ncbi:hypothetical protein TELCIR_02366 [Teladorsagia circumcincta]|uniref:Uncharacterized protein n=1 Tax=Teladorsagia circumcincta TaxID=45464 RepID=A0A2G9UZL5_TELCI|nr:hypothetical protein TELCIR_02366 [Teladorsagia circumcincta]